MFIYEVKLMLKHWDSNQFCSALNSRAGTPTVSCAKLEEQLAKNIMCNKSEETDSAVIQVQWSQVFYFT